MNKLVGLFSILVFLSGCEDVSYVVTVPIQSYLDTPIGKYNFRPAREDKAAAILNRRDMFGTTLLIADTPKVKVVFNFHSNFQNLIIAGKDLDVPVVIHFDRSTYTVGGMEYWGYQPLTKSAVTKRLSSEFKGTQRSPYEGFKAVVLSIPVDKLSYFDANENPLLHELDLPFSIGDEEYDIKLSMKMERRSTSKLKINVPGTP